MTLERPVDDDLRGRVVHESARPREALDTHGQIVRLVQAIATAGLERAHPLLDSQCIKPHVLGAHTHRATRHVQRLASQLQVGRRERHIDGRGLERAADHRVSGDRPAQP